MREDSAQARKAGTGAGTGAGSGTADGDGGDLSQRHSHTVHVPAGGRPYG